MKAGKGLAVAFIIAFSFLALFIDFFHTDSLLQVQEYCPACQFQRSIANISQYQACGCYGPPQLFTLEVVSIVETFIRSQISIANPTSRAPPVI